LQFIWHYVDVVEKRVTFWPTMWINTNVDNCTETNVINILLSSNRIHGTKIAIKIKRHFFK